MCYSLHALDVAVWILVWVYKCYLINSVEDMRFLRPTAPIHVHEETNLNV